MRYHHGTPGLGAYLSDASGLVDRRSCITGHRDVSLLPPRDARASGSSQMVTP